MQGAKDKVEEKWDQAKNSETAQQTSERAQGMWDKTKEVASDVKDSIAQTASNVYEKAKDMVSSDTTTTSTNQQSSNLGNKDNAFNKKQ